MNAIKMKWAPAAIGVNKDWIPNDFPLIMKMSTKQPNKVVATSDKSL